MRLSEIARTPLSFSRRWALRFALVILPCLCQGCAYLETLHHTYSPQAVAPRAFRFQDGGDAIYFSIDKSLQLEPAAPGESDIETVLFVISGSDCASMQYFLPQYFRGLEGESGPLRIFILHKRHIEAWTWGRTSGCSEEFVRDDHPRRWIADQTEFIRAQLGHLRGRSARLRRIVLAGISEGAEIVPALAHAIPEVTHAVIVANGGMDPWDTYRLQAQRHGFAAVLESLNHAAPADPDGRAHRIGGRTWRYWQELRQLNYADDLLALRIPLLVAMGEADRSVPIESALWLKDRYARAGKSNLVLLTYPGADHAFESKQGSRLPDLWHAVDLWLQQ